MLVVISPAKNLDLDSPLPAIHVSQPQMLEQAEQLVAQLKHMAPHELSGLMHISDKLGELNYERYQHWQRPFNPDNARPAVLTFAGDVYQSLAAHNFNDEDFAFAQRHLRILSGLYGVLRPLDLIQPYRLEMGTRLANSHGKDLYAFWGETITASLNQQITDTGATALINLASSEYFKSVKSKKLRVPVIEPVFKDYKNGQFKVISFFAKKARGLMSAYIVKNKLTACEDIKHFDEGGYQYNEALSSVSKWTFTRKE